MERFFDRNPLLIPIAGLVLAAALCAPLAVLSGTPLLGMLVLGVLGCAIAAVLVWFWRSVAAFLSSSCLCWRRLVSRLAGYARRLISAPRGLEPPPPRFVLAC